MARFPAAMHSEAREVAATPPRRRSSRTVHALTPTRERILNAAAQLFAEHGFASTSMPAIAARSEITAGAIYRHFASKAELLLEVVKRALEVLPFSFERSDGGQDAARLPDAAARLTDPALTLLRQLALEVHAAARRDPEVRTLLSAYNETTLRNIRALLKPTLHTDARDAPGHLEFTARAVMVFLMGLHHMDTLHPQLEGDPTWREFVAAHVAGLLGLPAPPARPQSSARRETPARRVAPLVRGESERRV